MTSTWVTLSGVLAIWSVAVVTPGPNFFITVRTGIVQNRLSALWVVMGIASGTFIWGVSGFLGISALFSAAPALYFFLKIIGGAYIVYLGLKLFISSFSGKKEMDSNHHEMMSPLSAYRLGLMTNLSNPKTAAFTASLFAAVMPESPNIVLGPACAFLMAAVSVLWYGFIAMILSWSNVSAVIKRIRKWIDRTAGVIFIGFGLKMMIQKH